jgi:4-hydroxy-tetrahydrodipicolinate synthase
MHATGLPFYSGDDTLNLSLLAVGACGFISVTGHIVADRIKAMATAYRAGDVVEAQRINHDLVPVTHGLMGRGPGAIASKAALDLLDRAGGGVMRLPMVAMDEVGRTQLRADLIAGGFSL